MAISNICDALVGCGNAEAMWWAGYYLDNNATCGKKFDPKLILAIIRSLLPGPTLNFKTIWVSVACVHM